MSPLGFILLLGLTANQNQPAAQSSDDQRAVQIQRFQPPDQQAQPPAMQQAMERALANLGLREFQKQAPGAQPSDQRAIQRQQLMLTMQRAMQQAREQALADTCYTIRSYNFKREDGNAPVLVGTTTCTPANQVRRQQVNRPPRVRLVPAN